MIEKENKFKSHIDVSNRFTFTFSTAQNLPFDSQIILTNYYFSKQVYSRDAIQI